MKILGRTLSLIIVAIPATLFLAVAFVLFTESGTRSVVGGIERLLPLEIDYVKGSLSGPLHFDRLLYETGDLRLELQNVDAELALACFWRGAICFRQLQVGDLDILLLPGAAIDQDDHADSRQDSIVQLIEFPVPLEADLLDVGSLRVRWAGGEWRQGALQGSVQLSQSTVQVLSARVERSSLTLQSTDSVNASDSEPVILPTIDLPLILSVVELQLIEPSWDLFGALFQQDEIVLRGQWQLNDLVLDGLEVRSGDLGECSLSGKLVFAGSWPLEASVVGNLAERLQYSDLLGESFRLSASGDLSALTLQVSSEGAVGIVGEGLVNVLDPALPFSSTATASSTSPLALAEIEGVPVLLQDTKLEFPFTVSASGSLKTQHFEFQGTASGLGYESLPISARAQHEQGHLILSDLSVQGVEGANELRASGEVMLSPGYSWSLALHSSGLDVPALSEAIHGRVDGSLQVAGDVSGERWQVRLSDVALQGKINELPVSISGFVGLDSDLRLSNSALQAQLNGAQLSVKSPGEGLGPGHLHLKIEDIGRWLSGSSGLIEVDAEVSAERKQVQFSGRLQKHRSYRINVDTATQAGQFETDAGHAFRLDIDMQNVAAGALTFLELQLSAHGDAHTQSITLASRGDVQGEFNVAGTIEGEEWRGALAPSRLQTPVGEWVLAEAVAMTGSFAEEQLMLDAHCWRHQYAQLCPGALALGAEDSGGIQLDGNLELLAPILPPDLDMQGDVHLQLDAVWAPGTEISVVGNAETGAVMFTHSFAEGESASFGWDEANVSLRYTREGLQLDMGVQNDSRRIVGLELLLPPDRQEAISGSVTINRLKVAALTPFIPAFSTLAGELSGDIALSGSIDKPQGFGKLTLAGGHVVLAGNPTQLENLELGLDVQGTGAEVRGTGVLGGGELKLLGRVDMDPDLQLELDIQGSDHTILYPPTTELLISEALKLTLKKDLLKLTGKLTVLDGVLEIEELPAGSVALSASVVEVNSDGEIIHEELPFKVRMNVQIHIEDRFRITGNMLETKLGGDLRVQQRPGQPLQLFGNLDTIGGEFRAYQTHLRIKRGTISFTGPPTNPTVNVRAERRIASSDVTVGVHVQGPVEDDLLLDIYSEPSMSQAEAMSYLIRGRGMDAGAGLDGTSAALSLASGVVNRSELVTELNRIPGISNVEFGADGSDTDATATVSGYLGERIYLSYGVGLYEPVNVLTSRFYFRSRLWLEVVSSLENSVDLYYSFDID